MPVVACSTAPAQSAGNEVRPATERACGGPSNYSDVDQGDLVPVHLVTAPQQSARHPSRMTGRLFLRAPTPRRTGKSWQRLYRVVTCFLPYTRSINAVSPCICTRTVLPSRMVNTSAS
jgi:hypothetical protein